MNIPGGGLGGWLVLIAVPMIINSFFGYKIQKFLITLSGIGVGALLGAIVGLFSREPVVIVLLALLLAILGGFLAFKLYKFGIFMQFWLLGTLVFAALFLVMGATDLIALAVILGLVIGVLALILHKGFVIITTAFSGGMIAGICIGMALGEPVACVLIGVALSVFGAIVQFSMEKKKPTLSQTNANGAMPIQASVNQVPENRIQASVNQMPENRTLPQSAQTIIEPVRSKPAHTELSKIIPKHYCPKSKLLIDLITLSKDNANETYFKLDFNNIGDNTLIAIYFKVRGYNIVGESLGEQEYNFIDLNIAPGAKFYSDEIQLFDSSIRKLEVILTQTVNSNYEVTKFDDSDTLTIPELTPVSDNVNEETAELLELKFDENYFYTPLSEGLWVCTCGNIGYHKCPHCGRTGNQSLKNTEEDIGHRIADNISKLLGETDACTTIRGFDGQKSKLERAIELLTKNEINDDLSNRCKSALDNIELRKKEIQSKVKKTKAKVKKSLVLLLICAIVVVLSGVAAKIITELPPSNRKIKADTEKYISENFEGKYTIQDLELDKLELYEGYRVTVYAKLKNTENKDILEATLRLDYFDKEYGRYVNTDGENITYTILPNHDITEKDEFSIPDLLLICDGSRIHIDQYTAKEMLADGSLNLVYDIKYSDIAVTDNTAEVPMTLHIDYLNASADAEVTISYIYSDNYYWEANEDIEIWTEPKVSLLDKVLMEQLIAGTNIRYDNALVPEDEMLSGEYIDLNNYSVSYYHGFTEAEMYGEFSWNNSRDKFTGTMNAMFEYIDGTWCLTDIQLADVSQPVRHTAMPDSELISILTPIISANCSEKTNISNISLLSQVSSGNEIVVNVQYNSENGNFLLRNNVSIVLAESLTQGFVFDRVQQETTWNIGLKEEKHETIPVNYRLSCDNATPVGVPSAGTANLNLDIDSSGNVKIVGSIGAIYLNLSGNLTYPNYNITINEFQQSVNVKYSFLITVSSDLAFRVNPSLVYNNGKLTGRISYTSVGIGAGDFDIIFE